MKRYCAFMDRTQVSPRFHRRLMETLDMARHSKPRGRIRPLVWTAAAVCCFLVLLLSGITPLWPQLQPSPTAGVAQPPSPLPSPVNSPPSNKEFILPSETGGWLEQSTPPAESSGEMDDPAEAFLPNESPAAAFIPPKMGEPDGAAQSATIVVTDPFEEQPHGNFALPALDIPDYTGRRAGMPGSRALPNGYFTKSMAAEEIVSVLGGGDAIPWELCWNGYGLWGTVSYDGQGQLWNVKITGQFNPQNHFTLLLSSGTLPIEASPDDYTFDYNGTAVSSYYIRESRNGGLYSYCTYFMTGDIGLLFFCSNSDQDTAALLTAALIRQYASGGPNLDNLVPETLPARREETLTLEQAREAALGIYLPESVPQRYSFQTAQSNSLEGQGETLLARWQAGEHVILIQIEHLPTYTSRPAAADFTPEEVTPQALESFSSSAAASGRSGAGYSFTVTFENVRVYYLVSGLSDIEAAALVVQPSL